MSREFPKNSEPKITPPTVGRIVHIFWPLGIHASVPRAAIVAHASPDHLRINVAVFNSDGSTGPLQNVRHASEPIDGSSTSSDPHWDWMDYQKGQAAKTEQLEQQLVGAQGGPSTIAPSDVVTDAEVSQGVSNFDHGNKS